MSDSPDRPTVTIPALALTGEDTILLDPDTGAPCVWQVTGRATFTEGRPLTQKVKINYFMPDDPSGTEGTHTFDDAMQDVTVRLPRYKPTAVIAA